MTKNIKLDVKECNTKIKRVKIEVDGVNQRTRHACHQNIDGFVTGFEEACEIFGTSPQKTLHRSDTWHDHEKDSFDLLNKIMSKKETRKNDGDTSKQILAKDIMYRVEISEELAENFLRNLHVLDKVSENAKHVAGKYVFDILKEVKHDLNVLLNELEVSEKNSS